MGVPTVFCLLGILTCSFFLGVDADSCPRDWMKMNGNCYAYFRKRKTWHDAEIQCQSNGRKTHLVSILSKQEIDLISSYIIKNHNPRRNVWIGLYDVKQKGIWKWTDESIFDYEAWRPGQPDNNNKRDFCAELNTCSKFKRWNQVYCNTLNPYICKHEI